MSTGRGRYGITVPFDGVSLYDHRRWFEDLEKLGYTDVWSAEVDGADGFTPLALAAAWAPTLQLGVAIAPAYTRGPALLAQTASAMAEAAPGRFTLGLGASSDVIVQRWNGVEYAEPYKKVRDTLRFLRAALTGDKVTEDYETFAVEGFRLSRPVVPPPPVFLAALRPGMLRLAGREADGVILNWLSADDVPKAVAEVGNGQAGGGAHLRHPHRRRGHRPGRRPADDHRLPQRPGLRRVPPLAGPRSAPPGRCGTPGRPATARPPCPPSPTRWWTP